MSIIISNYFEKDGWIEKEEPIGSFFDDKPVITDPLHGGVVNFSHYRKGFWKEYHRHTCSHGILVIGGQMKADDRLYDPGAFVWDPAGYRGGHGAAPGKDCQFLFISNLPFDIEFLPEPEVPEAQDLTLTTADVYQTQDWTPAADSAGNSYEEKTLVIDPVTGMTIKFLKCESDTQLRTPDMSSSYGFYVIEGALHAPDFQGSKGSLLWFTREEDPQELVFTEDTLLLFVSTAALNHESQR